MMSDFEFHARRVTDPKPSLHVAGLGSDFYLGTDLQSAWDVAGKAKSAMRHAEHNLHEADHPRVYPGGSALGMDSRSSINVDRVPRYMLDSTEVDNSSVATVDSMGRSSYMKSKMGLGSRKVSRMDNKYYDDENKEAVNKRTVSQENRYEDQPVPRYVSRRYYGSSTSDITGPTLRTTNNLPSKYRPSGDMSSTQDSTLNTTDSRALRETSVRFLNDDMDHNSRRRGHESASAAQGSRLTRVDVQVPSSQHSSQAARAKLAQPLSQRQETSVGAEHKPPSSMTTDTTYTLPEPKRTQRLRKSIKHMEENADGLTKLKELIRQQRSSWSSKDDDSDTVSHNGQETETVKQPHKDAEPVVPRHYDLYQQDLGLSAAPRKVASGPPPPAYKGFSESQTKYRTPDGKVIKASELAKSSRPELMQMVNFDKIVKSARGEKSTTALGTEALVKPSKPARVVAPQKVSKYEKKDIITTRSWRDGQKAVLRELGMNKINSKQTHSPPTRDRSPESTSGSTKNNEEIRPEQHDGGTTSVGDKPTTKLSDDARAILADLQSDKSDSEDNHKEDDSTKQRKRSPNRKKHHSKADYEREMKAQKIRHYDSDSVRKYMAKQKAERRKREQDERDAARKAQENKLRHLEQLYRAQRGKGQSGSKSKGQEKDKDSARKDVKFAPESNMFPKHSDTTSKKSESDKENRGLHPWSDVSSSDSATLTEDSMAERAPSSTIGAKHDADEVPEHGRYNTLPAQTTKDSGIDTAPDNFVSKYLQDTGITADEIIKKFSKDPGRTTGYAPSSSLPARELTTGSSMRSLLSSSGVPYRNRTERIQNIHQMALSLQTRIQEETKTIQGEKWAHPRGEEDYVSRYDRMTKKNDPYSVFDKNLPGVSNVHETAHRAEEQHERDHAAVQIQAAYRGHSVRQNLGWRLPQHKSISKPGTYRSYLHAGVHLSDDSLMSDATTTDDEFSLLGPKIGSGLSAVDFHRALSDDRSGPEEPEFAELPRPSRALPPKIWDKPHADPNNIFNVYYRKNRYTEKSDLGRGLTTSNHSLSPTSSEDTASLIRSTQSSPRSRHDDLSKHSLTVTSQRVSYKDDFTSVASSVASHTSHGKSSKSAVPASDRHSYRSHSHMSRASDHDKSDDTLDGTLTPPSKKKKVPTATLR